MSKLKEQFSAFIEIFHIRLCPLMMVVSLNCLNLGSISRIVSGIGQIGTADTVTNIVHSTVILVHS
jgi:hypothetical protein